MRKTITVLCAAALLAVATSYAAAETDLQWKPSVFNKLSKCRTLWIALGDVPIDSNAARDTTFVCHGRFALRHDNVTKTPDWVLERITKKQISGTFDRPSKHFTSEKYVQPSARAIDKDYPPEAVGLARGHMAPSEDFNSSLKAMKETFVLSNAVPQVASFNGGIWGRFEKRVRDIAFARETIHVITGPIRRTGDARTLTVTQAQNGCGREIKLEGPETPLVCKAKNENPRAKCKNGVAVPIAIYKIIYDAGKDEIYAFVMPNRKHDRGGLDELSYLDSFRVTVGAVENMTGIRFFHELPQQKQERLLNKCETKVLWAPERHQPKKKKKKKPR